MPQSLSKVVVHIIFSTKKREDFLNDSIRSNTHTYIASVLMDMKSFVYRVGGASDHIHIACTLPRTVSQSELLGKIKNASSKWIKEQGKKILLAKRLWFIFCKSISYWYIDKIH